MSAASLGVSPSNAQQIILVPGAPNYCTGLVSTLRGWTAADRNFVVKGAAYAIVFFGSIVFAVSLVGLYPLICCHAEWIRLGVVEETRPLILAPPAPAPQAAPAALAAAHAEVAQLKQNVQTADHARVQAERVLVETQAKMGEQVKGLENQVAHEKAASAQATKPLEAEITKLLQQAATHQKAAEQAREAHNTAQQDVTALQKEVEDVTKARVQAEKDLKKAQAEAEEQVKTLTETVQVKEAALKQVRKEKQALQTTLAQVGGATGQQQVLQQLTELGKDLREAETARDTAISDLAKQKHQSELTLDLKIQELEALQQRFNALEKKFNEATRELEATNKTLDAARQTMSKLQQSYDAITEQLIETKKAHQEALNKAHADLQSKVTELTQLIERQKELHKTKLQQEKKAAEATLGKAQEELTHKSSQVDTLKQQVAQLETTIEAQRKEAVEEAQATIEGADQAQRLVEQAEKHQQDLAKTTAELNDTKKALAKLEQDFSMKTTELESTKKQTQLQIEAAADAYKTQIRDLKETERALREKEVQHAATLAQLKVLAGGQQDVADIAKTFESLKQQAAKTQSENQRLNAQHGTDQGTIRQLEKRVTEHMGTAASLRQELVNKEKEIGKAAAQKATIEEQAKQITDLERRIRELVTQAESKNGEHLKGGWTEKQVAYVMGLTPAVFGDAAKRFKAGQPIPSMPSSID